MLRSRDPDKPGIPPAWTENYDTYEQALYDQMKDKTRQDRRRLLATVVALSVAVAAACFLGYVLPHLV